MATNIFTRVPSKDPAVGDLYDKVANILQQMQTTTPSPSPTPAPTPTPVIPIIPSGGGGGGGGGSPSQYAYTNVPVLPLLPSNNPTTGAPYAQDGVLVIVDDVLYRYFGNPEYQWKPAVTAVILLIDTYVNWTLANYDPAGLTPGTLFFISDRRLTYIVQTVSGSNEWVYSAGIYAVTQSSISGINGFNGAALGLNDTDLQINVTDYAHVLEWSGSAWAWGPGESGSGYIQDFAVAPTGSGWHVCDGSAGVAYLKADGTTGTLTLPNVVATASYRKGSNGYTSSITGAAVPTISGKTELASTGITVSAAAAATAGSGSINNPATGTPVTVLEPPFTGGGGGGSVTDPQHQHNLTSGNAPISLAGGDPVAHYSAIPYFRQ